MAADKTFEAWWRGRPEPLAALNPGNEPHDHAKDYARAAWQARGEQDDEVAKNGGFADAEALYMPELGRLRAEVERLTADRKFGDRLRESLMAVMDIVHQQGAGLWPCCGQFYEHAPACPMSIAQGLVEEGRHR